MTTSLVAGIIVIALIAVAILYFTKKKRVMDERDKRIVLQEETIKVSKAKLKELEAKIKQSDEEFEDAFNDYNTKYRPDRK